jgi:hypothetical protein
MSAGKDHLHWLGPGVLVALLSLSVLLVGGCPASDLEGSAHTSPDRWKVLFNGQDLSGFRRLGPARVEQGRLVLAPGLEGKTILISTALDVRDGELEVRALRQPGPAGQGPYTISVRTYPDLLDWRAVYVVCRPGYVEIVRGARNDAPDHVAQGPVEPIEGVETWRIVMQGGTIDCYRQEEHVTRYLDPIPEAGTVCLTADGVNVEILSIRYRALDASAATQVASEAGEGS